MYCMFFLLLESCSLILVQMLFATKYIVRLSELCHINVPKVPSELLLFTLVASPFSGNWYFFVHSPAQASQKLACVHTKECHLVTFDETSHNI